MTGGCELTTRQPPPACMVTSATRRSHSALWLVCTGCAWVGAGWSLGWLVAGGGGLLNSPRRRPALAPARAQRRLRLCFVPTRGHSIRPPSPRLPASPCAVVCSPYPPAFFLSTTTPTTMPAGDAPSHASAPSSAPGRELDDAPPLQPTLDEIRQQYEEVGHAPPVPNIPLPDDLDEGHSTPDVARIPSQSQVHRQSIAPSMRPSFSHAGDEELDVSNLPITDAQRARIVSRQYVPSSSSPHVPASNP